MERGFPWRPGTPGRYCESTWWPKGMNTDKEAGLMAERVDGGRNRKEGDRIEVLRENAALYL